MEAKTKKSGSFWRKKSCLASLKTVAFYLAPIISSKIEKLKYTRDDVNVEEGKKLLVQQLILFRWNMRALMRSVGAFR